MSGGDTWRVQRSEVRLHRRSFADVDFTFTIDSENNITVQVSHEDANNVADAEQILIHDYSADVMNDPEVAPGPIRSGAWNLWSSSSGHPLAHFLCGLSGVPHGIGYLGMIDRMLVIREEQRRRFSELSLQRFEDRAERHLAEQHPVEYARMGEAGTRAFIKRVIETAKKNGLTLEGSVLLLADLMCEFGERFERSPEGKRAMKLLEHPTLPGPAKMEGVRNRLRESTGGMKMVVYR